MPIVCVYAASSTRLPDEVYATSHAVGRALGRRGWDLIFGGANIGNMNAVARGFRETSRQVISIIPRLFDDRDLTFTDSTEIIITEDLRERKRIMAERAAAFLALPGGIGTMDEFYETLVLKQLEFHTKPMILFNEGGHFDPSIEQIRRIVDGGYASPRLLELFDVAPSVDDLLALPCFAD